MALWLSLGGLAAVVLLLLLRPLLSAARSDPASRAEHDIVVFRAQLIEIERDQERGLLPDSEAQAARREVERRLLAAGERAEQASALTILSRPWRIALTLFLLVALPASAFQLYLSLGQPSLPGQPFASRPAPQDQTAQDEQRLAALESFEQRARDNPDDPGNWLNLGRINFSLGRYEESADAFSRALDVTQRHPGALSLYGEALVYAAEGFITEGARGAFNEALAADPAEPRALYYNALADYQAGRRELALDNWLELATGAPADAVWLPAVRDRIRAVATELGRDADALLATTATPAPPAQVLPAPSALDGDQLEQIRGMVGGLAERLAKEPDDLEGWLMLGRSYMVLHQPRDAVDALTQATKLAPERPQILTALLIATANAAAEDEALAERLPALTQQVLRLDPENPDALWYAGVTAERAGNTAQARDFWQKLLALLPADGQEYTIVKERLEAAR